MTTNAVTLLAEQRASAELDRAVPKPSVDTAVSIPYGFARRYGVLVTQWNEEHTYVVHKEDVSPTILSEIRRVLSLRLKLNSVSSETFEQLLAKHYDVAANQSKQVMEDVGAQLDLEHIALALGEPEDLLESADDAPIIRLINALLAEAIKENASDIHIEPYETRVAIRFRVDGVLREILQPRQEIAPLLVSRIKIMAHLDIAEKRLPQDGRISLRIAGRPVDVRVSTLPANTGERVVLRLLDKKAGRLDLKRLGMNPEHLQIAERMVHHPHGIILVTGPTGSGKTTTLYAALDALNDRSRNIVTVEDPIEYYLDGIGQTQVNTKVDMTFARGLRAILRQDPDVVMVGEIRDLETANIAVQASLTGHIVFSTLHTNSAIGAVTRLRDMGIEPFLLASSLVGVIAQRLIRLLCLHCKQPYTPDAAETTRLGITQKAHSLVLYRAVGCAQCHGSGYRGRTGIYTLLEINQKQRELILQGAGESEMLRHASGSSQSLRADGIRRILAGDTSHEEVTRVTAAT